MKNCFPTAFLMMSLALPAVAAEPKDLAPLLAPIAEKYKLPGLIAAVVEGDQVAELGAVGMRKLDSNEPFTAQDVIHLGSNTKAMTALLIGLLIEEGKFGWDTTVAELFPDLASEMHDKLKGATVLQLMSHTAGVEANVMPPLLDALTGKSVVEQRRAVMKLALAREPQDEPGTKFSYSNTGYVILGAIIDAKSGQPWEEFIRTRLFEPLEMKSAGFGPPGTRGKADQPWGHLWRDEKFLPVQADNPEFMNPAGRAHMTMPDWAKFVSLYLDAAQGRPRLASAETFRTLTTPVPPGEYAGGWGVVDRSWAEGQALTHAGSNTMWFCVAWVAPKRNVAVLVATNAAGGQTAKACDDAATAILLSRAQR